MADSTSENPAPNPEPVEVTVVNPPAEVPTPGDPEFSEEFQHAYEDAKEQAIKDEEAQRENRDGPVVREANPKFGGEAFR